jgi:hypothetical protein
MQAQWNKRKNRVGSSAVNTVRNKHDLQHFPGFELLNNVKN